MPSAAAILVLATGCSGVDDLPDDAGLASCLEAAGVDPDGLGGAEERREAFAEPAALSCVADLESPADQRQVLGDVFDYDQLWPVVQDWIGTRTGSADSLARSTGELLRAADVDDDDLDDAPYEPAQVLVALAYAVYAQTVGVPPSYQAWLDDPDAQQSVSESDPLSGPVQYLGWLSDPANDDQATGEAIRALELIIKQARSDD